MVIWDISISLLFSSVRAYQNRNSDFQPFQCNNMRFHIGRLRREHQQEYLWLAISILTAINHPSYAFREIWGHLKDVGADIRWMDFFQASPGSASGDASHDAPWPWVIQGDFQQCTNRIDSRMFDRRYKGLASRWSSTRRSCGQVEFSLAFGILSIFVSYI